MSRKPAGEADPWMCIDRESASPLVDQIYAAFSGQIARGILREGHRLPSTRNLSKLLGVSRSTVSSAFDLLLAEDLIRGQAGSGTYVSPSSTHGAAAAPASVTGVGEVARKPEASGLVLSPGPTVEHFPFAAWEEIAGEIVPQMRAFSATGDPAGYAPLRAAIAEFTRRERGIDCSADQVIVTIGATQAFDMIARTLAQPGDVALIEDPSEPRIAGTLLRAGLQIGPVPVDEQGADIGLADWPATAARPPKLVHVTPVRQFPLGTTLSPARETALVEAAGRMGSWIVEWDSTLTVAPPRAPLMAARDIDQAGMIYYTSLSWVLFRALRIGYIIAPRSLVAPLIATRQFMDVHPPVFEQAILAKFIQRGHMARYIERMRGVNEVRRASLVEGWPDALVPSAQLREKSGGLGNVLFLPPGTDDAAIVAKAQRRGVFPLAISGWYLQRSRPGLYIGYGRTDPRRTVEALRQLALVLHGEFDAAS